jgi:transposase-like protein
MGETEEQKTRKEMTRRQFDDEFKKDAVRLVESGNLSVRQVAEDLGISKATLSKKARQSPQGAQRGGGHPRSGCGNPPAFPR